jgi:hypothetical protein
MINNDLIEKIYVENLDTLHPKLIPIPLGIYPPYYPEYVSAYMPLQLELNLSSERPIDVFCGVHAIRDGPQWENRKIVANLCKTEWKSFVTWSEPTSIENFRDILLQSKFVLCVHGGGFDPSPRAWESLLCGCIPIILSTTLDDAYSKFPVIFVDKWDSDTITKDKLDVWAKKYEYIRDVSYRKSLLHKLSINYWWDQISDPTSLAFSSTDTEMKSIVIDDVSLDLSTNTLKDNKTKSLFRTKTLFTIRSGFFKTVNDVITQDIAAESNISVDSSINLQTNMFKNKKTINLFTFRIAFYSR